MVKPVGPAPGLSSLTEAAARHLARYATTEAGLVRVLDRKVHRWARAATAEGLEITSAASTAKAVVRVVAKSMVDKGLINDTLFASARAARLTRAGRSNRAVTAYLADKGISAETLRAALPGPEREISAAIAYARRRRLGPFHVMVLGETETHAVEDRRQELCILGRAGFPRDVAERALRMSRDVADALLLTLKRG